MKTEVLKAESRTEVGTRACRKLRSAARIPAVIYGHKEAPVNITFELHDVAVALQHGAHTLEVSVDGQSGSYLIKEVQYDHLEHTPIHVDLARVDVDERVRVKVGVELRGVPKGVSDGGVLEQYISDLEVECRMTDIPETLRPMVTELGLNEFLLVGELQLPEGVVACAGAGERIAGVRALVEEVESEEAEGEPEQPEIIGRAKKDDGADAEKS